MTFDEALQKVSDCKTLDELFSLWIEAHKLETNYEETTITEPKIKKDITIPGISKDSFIKDGYINFDKYESSKRRILFILKESNIQGYMPDSNPSEGNQVPFYTNYINGLSSTNRPRQHEKMGRIAHYLFTGSDISDETVFKKDLECCAFMNVNKRGGKEKTNNKRFNNYISKYHSFIRKQIQIINPDYVVIIGKQIPEESFLPEGIEHLKINHTADRFHGTYKTDAYVKAFISAYEK